MNRDGHKDVAYFIGPEVEHTPAYSKRTLFVVGKQDVAQIELMAREWKTPHIFLGANHSFAYENPGDNSYWDKTITALLDVGFSVTLDYPAHQHEQVLKMLNPGIWQSRLFVPLLSVRIPKVQTSSVNLTIKIDDIDFNSTNEGVWCLHHHQVTDSNRFTPWQDYTTDTILDPIIGAVPNPVLTIPAVKAEKPNKAQMQDTMSAFAGSLAARDMEALKEPVYADINKPDLIKYAAEKLQVTQNDSELGLDTESPSKLKPDPEEVVALVVPATAEDAAEAYADGAKEDPLGPKGAVKPAKAKK